MPAWINCTDVPIHTPHGTITTSDVRPEKGDCEVADFHVTGSDFVFREVSGCVAGADVIYIMSVK